ncbi:autotransporter outer membrane beta-barrel domain-containing protein [Pantoea sp. BIGb0393]|uniref:S6 family peptidase n=1 Tax=Pantoea nemavictus TaxID=2726955 RepID=A0ABU8PN58_9GAMM|nr:autotransporter outer membrane beta-barrel domain-containing protein [Pantoea nemavictus]
MKKAIIISYGTLFICLSSSAGVMRHDINVQDYRDFAENMGKYRVGVSNIPVYKKNGELDAYISFPMPDMSSISRRGFAALTAPSYVMSARHVHEGFAYFGAASEFSRKYIFINRNAVDDSIDQDYMLPRLSKVVTEVAPTETVENSEWKAGRGTRYIAYARAGGGYQRQINDQLDGFNSVASYYKWLAGGTINPDATSSTAHYFYWTQYNPDDPRSSPLSFASQSGDSGSPIYVYDAVDKKWKLMAALRGRTSGIEKYGLTSLAALIPDGYYDNIVSANTSPDVTDIAGAGDVFWNTATIDQGNKQWSWQGIAEKYRHLAPGKASLEELDASKDIRFNGAGGDIILSDAVNLGAGKLQFSNNYRVKSAAGADATWVGGGIEVDADKKVLWQVNGLADDDLHKIGAGTLHVNASGKNEGGLNVGDGTVILDQQADAQGNQQAFSRVTIVSGRPTVVLNNDNQVAGDDIFFGYRGGRLDLNGHDLMMKRINHTDSGATLLNQSADRASSLTLTGFAPADITIQEWNSATHSGSVGDIYEDWNDRSQRIEYFQLKTGTYSYFPTNQQDNSYWKYIGFDAEEAKTYRAMQFNDLVFRGYLGSDSADGVNGKFDFNFSPALAATKLALTGGSNLSGNINLNNGTLLLSGQPVPHAGGLIIDDDWTTSTFIADNIVAASNTRLQVGEYAQVKANIQAGDNSQVLLGYQPGADAQQQILRCVSPVQSTATSCETASRDAAALSALPASTVHGDITLGDQAELYLGKVDFRGRITDRNAARVTMSGDTFWNLTGDSRMQRLNAPQGGIISALSDNDKNWTPKQLWVENLYASNLQLGFGIAPQTGISDSLYVDKSAQGSGNTLDLGFMLGETFPDKVPNQIVLLDTPAGTAHDYFTLPPIKRGFSIYSPDYQVIETDGRVKWVIAKTPVPVVDPAPEPKPDPIVDPAPEPKPDPIVDPTPEPKPDPVIDPAPEPKPDPIVDPAPEPKPEPVVDPAPEPGKPEDWFNISDNDGLLHSTRALLASRQYLFSETAASLNDRAQTLRGDAQMHGVWGGYSYNRGGIADVSIRQQSFELGVDKQVGAWRVGLMASHGQGSGKGMGSISHQLSTLGTYASWLADGGWFADLAARYMHLRQDLKLDPALEVKGTQRSSQMLAASAKVGRQMPLFDDSFTLSPFVETRVGYLPGYRLQGYDASITLSSATPWSVSPGIELRKRGLGSVLPAVSLFAGISKQYSPGSSGSTLTLADSHASRTYDAWSDNRYRLHAGFEGQISENWSLQVGAKHSAGGKFQTDTAFNGALNYSF